MKNTEIAQAIAAITSRPCVVIEVPPGIEMPFYNINPSPGVDREGGLGSPNSIETRQLMIDVVGSSVTQIEEAENRLVKACNAVGTSSPHIQGVPTIRYNGGARLEDRVYRSIVTVTFVINH